MRRCHADADVLRRSTTARRERGRSMRFVAPLGAVGASLVFAACTGDAAPLAPRAPAWMLSAIVARNQVGLAGSEALAPAVVVTDSAGRAAPNVAVRFAVQDGDGVLELGRAITDGGGRASAGRWVLGPALGLQRVRAEVVDEPAAAAEFMATAIPPQGPFRMDGRCALPDSLVPAGWSLPRTAERVARRLPLLVVAIGSSSTQGVGASVIDSAYPALLARHLRRMYPASSLTVVNAGRGGQQLDQLQARFDSDLVSRAPHLVVLQTGTVDAVNGVTPEAFETRLRAAVAAIVGIGADLVLLDSQRYPQFGEGATYRAFQRATRRVADEHGIPLVRRYDMMSHWVQAGVYTYPQLLATDFFHPSDLTYSCTGRALAEGIAGAIRGASGR